MILSELTTRARAWAACDPDPDSRAELLQLLEEPDLARTDLADRFAGPLEFGTAGLRGVLGAGPNRMNRFVVMRTTRGLADVLLSRGAAAPRAGVVVGFDGRRLSRELAEDTACVLAAAGVAAYLFEVPAPTPITGYAVGVLRAFAGVVITASHNPPEYNGYKVYWENAAQIVPPVDAEIARAIGALPLETPIPRLALADARARGLVREVPAAILQGYFDAVHALCRHGDRAWDLPIAYTALHGVGDAFVHRALAEAGFSHVVSVPEQREPDGAFPTVRFPNPEEKGAMDLALQVARRMPARLVLANDPDADRLAAAIPDPDAAGGFRLLTGNQLGVLLGHYLLTETPSAASGAAVATNDTRTPAVLASIVSSPMLSVIAAELGAHYEVTLTGFKWIANRAIELEREGRRFVFGYEEALGYTVGTLVHDKDGVSAAVVFAELAAVLEERGSSLLAELERLYRRYGLFVSTQVTVTRPGAAGIVEIAAMMAKLRAAPPRALDAFAVTAVQDFEKGTRVTREGASSTLRLPAQNMLIFELAEGSRVIARPSGTEPKLKFYVDYRGTLAEGERLAEAEARAATVMTRLAAAVVAAAANV